MADPLFGRSTCITNSSRLLSSDCHFPCSLLKPSKIPIDICIGHFECHGRIELRYPETTRHLWQKVAAKTLAFIRLPKVRNVMNKNAALTNDWIHGQVALDRLASDRSDPYCTLPPNSAVSCDSLPKKPIAAQSNSLYVAFYKQHACEDVALARQLRAGIIMKMFLLSLFAVCSLTTITGCSCDDDRHVTSTCESASVDSKDMHPRHHHQDQ